MKFSHLTLRSVDSICIVETTVTPTKEYSDWTSARLQAVIKPEMLEELINGLVLTGQGRVDAEIAILKNHLMTHGHVINVECER